MFHSALRPLIPKCRLGVRIGPAAPSKNHVDVVSTCCIQRQKRFVNVPPSKAKLELPVSQNDLIIGKMPSYMQNKEISIEAMVDKLEVRLTEAELDMLRKKLDRNQNGIVSKAELAYAGHKARDERSARELCLSVVEQPVTQLDQVGAKVITAFDFTGTALFSAVGTLAAGDCGMNMIGCCLVGCVSAMGGGTLNNLLYGSTIVGKTSAVYWCKDWRYLAVAVTASLLTFFAWPLYVTKTSEHYLTQVFGKDNLEPGGGCGKRAFVEACRRDRKLLNTCRKAMPFANPPVPERYYDLLVADGSSFIYHEHLKALVQKSFENSVESYILDTVAMSAFTVSATNHAVAMGLHPVVAATSGVTMCFGGLFRDLFCQRDLRIAGQSFAFCTGAGAIMYVALRELALRGFRIPLIGRVCLSAGTTTALRAWEYMRGRPLLSPMHGEKEAKANAKIKRMRTVVQVE